MGTKSVAPAANLADVRLVLDMLQYIKPNENTKAAHDELIRARRLFLETGSLGAWDRCVIAARRYHTAAEIPDRPVHRRPKAPSKLDFNPFDLRGDRNG